MTARETLIRAADLDEEIAGQYEELAKMYAKIANVRRETAEILRRTAGPEEALVDQRG